MRPGRLVRKTVGGENLEALAARRYHPQLGTDALRLAPRHVQHRLARLHSARVDPEIGELAHERGADDFEHQGREGRLVAQ